MLDNLRAHIASEHETGAEFAEVMACRFDDVLAVWHRWEHHPRYGCAAHAHDELTARRLGVPIMAVTPDG
jgi:hypothetical protein